MAGKRQQRKSKRSKATQSEGAESADHEVIVIPDILPVLPARDLVAFPSVMMSLYVGRPQSVKAVEQAVENENLLLILVQRNQETEDPAPTELFSIGVVASVVRTLKLPDGRMKVLLQGLVRAQVDDIEQHAGYLRASIDPLPDPTISSLSKEDEQIVKRIRENLQVLVQYEHLPEEMLLVTEEITDPGTLCDVILAHYKIEPAYAQNILEELDPLKRLRITDTLITDDLNQFMVSEQIRDKTRDELSKGQKEYYLREQLKQIQRELGDQEGTSEDLAGLREALERAKLPEQARAEGMKQLKRIERMSPESSEYALLRTYLEWLADLPWAVRTEDTLDLTRAREVLEEDHFGLQKVKERILEYLSVRKLRSDPRGPILCFVGPPGVGKTSLGKSIAQALGRKFFRISLGGVRDEAEIRGHRRTYVGALPGRIVQGLKQVGSKNPVVVLDELDKLGNDFRGDPAAALLEVLDPAQNQDFRDHYLGVPFDLSEVMFIATANTMDTVPSALTDRLEVIHIPGYTTEEKLAIAERYLVPRQRHENGLAKVKVHFTKPALTLIIERYTREAGVRNLEREIASVCRKIARQYAEGKRKATKVDEALVRQFLGPTKFDPEDATNEELVGLVRGLAWTTHGGEVMPVEASVAPGSGKLILTGQLGQVMQESAQAALFYARANADALGLPRDFHSVQDIHLHVPGGATPKDGPSAGITIATALISALSGRKASRRVAMTGEITLRGSVLAVGGLKEKALAALRFGISQVIIPHDNLKDLEEIPEEQRAKLTFIPVKHISEVLEIALQKRSPRASAATSVRRVGASKKVRPSARA